MSKNNSVLEELQNNPWFRERKNKNLGIARLLKHKHNIVADEERIKIIIKEAITMDRTWRKCLEEDKSLRGSDYHKKGELEKEAQRELGYNV